MKLSLVCLNSNFKSFAASAFVLLCTWYSTLAQHQPELWGSTSYGGPDNKGYIFKYDVRGNQFTRMSYFNKNLFNNYYSNFFAEKNGLLYAIKGQNDSVDHSAIISWDPASNEMKTLYRFDPAKYGSVSSSLSAFNGKFYGVAWGGFKAPNQPVNGIIFEWDPVSNVVTNKRYFEGLTGGANPWGELLLYNGKFYGVTANGGHFSSGTLFEWDPVANLHTVKAYFINASTGATPNGFLQIHNDKLYGLCLIGGANSIGSIFEYNLANGALFRIHDFTARAIWGKPVVANGKFYTAEQSGWGEIVALDLTSRAVTKHTPFAGAGIQVADAPLTYHNGTFYIAGTRNFNDSTIICSWKPGEPALTRIDAFNSGTIGRGIHSPLTAFNNKLYGITDWGSVAGRGSIFEVDTAAVKVKFKNHFGTYIDAYTFAGPGSNLIYHKNRFYAASTNGGHYDAGVLFSVDPETGATSRLYDFPETEGHDPFAHITMDQTESLHGLVWTRPGGSTPHYVFDLNTHKLVWRPDLPAHSDLPSVHQVQNSYLAIDSFLYLHRDGNGIDPAGIYRCRRGTQNFTLYYAFPVAILPRQETGLTSYNGQILGFAQIAINGIFKYAIYEFNPVTFTFRYELVESVSGLGFGFSGQPVELNNKIYVLNSGGCFSQGSLIEWDRSADTAIQHCIANPFSSGSVFGTPTVADGKIYGYSVNGIFCFDPGDKSFKLIYNGNPSLFGAGGTYYGQKLTLRMSNTSPKVTAASSFDICLKGSLTRDIPFTVLDGESDAFTVTATSSDTSIVNASAITITHVANQQYNLRFTASNKPGRVTILLQATDSLHARGTRQIFVNTTSPAPISFTLAADTLCTKDSAFKLTGGLPAGGIYLVDGIQSDSVAPGNLTAGRHTIIYKYENGSCVDSISRDIYLVDCPAPNMRVAVFPNPSRGEVKIENKNNLLSTVTVLTANGNMIMKLQSASHPIKLDLSKVQNGLYYITISNENGTVSSMVEILR